jgi:hypothetical protein
VGSDRLYDWAHLKRVWISGKYKSLRIMAEAEKVSYSTLCKRSAEYKWSERKERVKENAEQKVEEKVAQIAASRYTHIIEQQFKYADILIGLGFNSFKGKTKITSEANALSSIRLGLETQRRAVRGFAPDDEDATLTPIAGPVFNQQINIYADLKPVNQVNQIADTINILVDQGVIPSPKGGEVDGDE